jgi:hypothetical protein
MPTPWGFTLHIPTTNRAISSFVGKSPDQQKRLFCHFPGHSFNRVQRVLIAVVIVGCLVLHKLKAECIFENKACAG